MYFPLAQSWFVLLMSLFVFQGWFALLAFTSQKILASNVQQDICKNL